MVDATERRFALWLQELVRHAISEAELQPDVTAPFWRECFNDGMTVEQAFQESFVEQDGL
jgi:hypothetical protein